jgi:inosine-uridine nucleoside N-ribohydrolase
MALVSPKKVIIDTDPGIGKQTPCYSQTLSLSLSRGMNLMDQIDAVSKQSFEMLMCKWAIYHHRADDAMAILFAFQSPELDVIGLTTTYGNVKTTMATNNALHLVWRSSSLSLSLSVCVSPFQFVLFLQFQLCVNT